MQDLLFQENGEIRENFLRDVTGHLQYQGPPCLIQTSQAAYVLGGRAAPSQLGIQQIRNQSQALFHMSFTPLRTDIQSVRL
jgi:hypothetical protein